MKKYMVADLVKDIAENRAKDLVSQFGITITDAKYLAEMYPSFVDQENIAQLMDRYKCSRLQAEQFYQDYPNSSEWDDVDATAESLNISPLEVESDDVEAYMEIQDLGGSRGKPYSERESSIGKVFIYIYLGKLFLFMKPYNGNPMNYPITREEARAIMSADSFGEYFNQNMRNNDKYSDLPGSWGCVGPNPDSPKRLMTLEDKAKLPKDLQNLI